jgi:tetratricopeptide (TPR) repeat protein
MYHQADQIFQNAREYEKAAAQYNRALAINPAFSPSCEGISNALRRKGLYRESIEAHRQFYKRNASFYDTEGAIQVLYERLAHAYAVGGKKGYWRYLVDRTDRERSAYIAAYRYAQLGDSDNAMLWLEKAVQGRESDALGMKVDPDLDPLRSDPRFADLVRSVGFPQ